MEPGTSQQAIQEFKQSVYGILYMLKISVDEERTTFLATLAKIEETVDALSE